MNNGTDTLTGVWSDLSSLSTQVYVSRPSTLVPPSISDRVVDQKDSLEIARVGVAVIEVLKRPLPIVVSEVTK